MSFSNLKITYKILALVAVMSLVTGAVGYIGYYSVGQLGAMAKQIDNAGDHVLKAARANLTILSLNRAEYRLGMDPSVENIKLFQENVPAYKDIFEKGMADIKVGATEQEKELLSKAEDDYKAYILELDDTFVTAQRYGKNIDMNDASKAIVGSVNASRPKADKIQASIKAIADHFDDEGNKVAENGAKLTALAQNIMIAAALVGVVIGGIGGFLIGAFGISAPIGRGVDGLRELAAGNLDVSIFGVGRKDEIGDIANAAQVFKENALHVAALRKEQEEAKARAEAERRKSMLEMADQFESAVMSLVKGVAAQATQMQAASQQMTASAQQSQVEATAVSAAAEQTSANVQTVATATEELSSSVGEISRQVEEAARISRMASDETKRTNDRVSGLAEAADRIGEVVKLINDIASQTNLLALNASIEAARAGEAGKGFAVVANEVKHLAAQTANATEEIGAQIGAVQEETRRTVEAIHSIDTVIEQVREISSGIASAVEEQGAATQEIARNVQQAAQGTEEVSHNIVDITEAAGVTGATSQQVLSGANELAQNSTRLKDEVVHFLDNVRAA